MDIKLQNSKYSINWKGFLNILKHRVIDLNIRINSRINSRVRTVRTFEYCCFHFVIFASFKSALQKKQWKEISGEVNNKFIITQKKYITLYLYKIKH